MAQQLPQLDTKNYRWMLKVLGFSLLLNVVFSIIFAWTVIDAPSAQYYATTIRGRITPLVPLAQPNIPPTTLLQWASLAAVSVNTYDFANYTNEINSLEQYFTAAGWDQFITAWNNSQNLQNLIKNKLTVSAVTSNPPIITRQGIENNVYTSPTLST